MRPGRIIRVTPVHGPWRPSGKMRLKRQLSSALILCGALMILAGVALLLVAEVLIMALPAILIGAVAFVVGCMLFFLWSEDNPPLK